MASILMVPMKRFPSQHAMLEAVYSRILPARGHRIAWMMLANPGSPERTSWNGTEVRCFPSPGTRGIGGYLRDQAAWLRLLAATWRLCRRERFDVVQVRNSVTAGLVAWALARTTSARFVFQFSFPVPEGRILAAREGRARMPWLQVPLARAGIALRNWLIRRADLTLAISGEMRRQLLALGVPPGRVLAFPLGTESPPEPPAAEVERLRERYAPDGLPVVLYFGTISADRRLDFLVRVAGRVARSHRARWLFVGPAAPGERARLERVAREEGVAELVTFTGAVPRERIPAFLSLASVSASPIPPVPLFWLSSPTKLVESLAMGCPVVATDIPDQADVVAASGGGLIAPFEEEAFAGAVRRLLDDPALARAMGEGGREHVRSARSYEALAGMVEREYRRLARPSPAGSGAGEPVVEAEPGRSLT